ncbi:MarR family transcriptional regulator [Acidaminobacter sp. JC074]|uniref:MarR family winged helix-turn-helix transcriptional regulator n=1 Tax=Acidaminobacter sp. JC074 TaxID=2530199 RepID=UPI001F0E2CA7|nr:MarR family transcriptional regulator [Acidaminobacter sp. JC074]MCH4886475.1 MarR family transcriptional regulator [Acidaminobacter sp. JC074]
MANKQLIIDAKYPTKFKVVGLIQCISHEIEAQTARLLKPFGISNTQLMILHELDLSDKDALTVNEIKERMVDESPNVSRSLSGLEKMGYIMKTRDKNDKRIVYISLTEEGVNLHHDCDRVITSQPDTLTLNEDEVQTLYELLKKI